METLTNLYDSWSTFVRKNRDPRSDGMFMVESFFPSFIICLLYVIIVSNGERLMRNRQAYSLRNLMVIYNFAMVALSGYLFFEFMAAGWYRDYSLGCQLCDFSYKAKPMRMVKVCHLFFLSKYIELLDTVFFVLRKKFNQVSFLHVFHHGIMPCSWWFGVRFAPGGMGTFHALVNSLIHFIMYTYYGVAALGPQYQKYLWWKRYITQMQMFQFIIVLVHALQLFFIDCDYPKHFAIWIAVYAVIFLVFFSNFFLQEYIHKKNKKHASLHHHQHHHHNNNNNHDAAIKYENGSTSNGKQTNGDSHHIHHE